MTTTTNYTPTTEEVFFALTLLQIKLKMESYNDLDWQVELLERLGWERCRYPGEYRPTHETRDRLRVVCELNCRGPYAWHSVIGAEVGYATKMLDKVFGTELETIPSRWTQFE